MTDADNAPAALRYILAQDSLGSWLPFALADLVRLQCAKPPPIEDIFRGWGLNALADQVRDARRERDVDSVLSLFM